MGIACEVRALDQFYSLSFFFVTTGLQIVLTCIVPEIFSRLHIFDVHVMSMSNSSEMMISALALRHCDVYTPLCVRMRD